MKRRLFLINLSTSTPRERYGNHGDRLPFVYDLLVCRDITCSAADKDLVAVVTGKVDEEGQYVRRANLVRLDGGSPEDTDVGTVTSLGELPSLDGVQW